VVSRHLLSDGMADLGAIAAEIPALGIDPYPRKPAPNSRDRRPSGRFHRTIRHAGRRPRDAKD